MDFNFNFNAMQPSEQMIKVMEDCKNHPGCEGCSIKQKELEESNVTVWCENTASKRQG